MQSELALQPTAQMPPSAGFGVLGMHVCAAWHAPEPWLGRQSARQMLKGEAADPTLAQTEVPGQALVDASQSA